MKAHIQDQIYIGLSKILSVWIKAYLNDFHYFQWKCLSEFSPVWKSHTMTKGTNNALRIHLFRWEKTFNFNLLFILGNILFWWTCPRMCAILKSDISQPKRLSKCEDSSRRHFYHSMFIWHHRATQGSHDSQQSLYCLFGLHGVKQFPANNSKISFLMK